MTPITSARRMRPRIGLLHLKHMRHLAGRHDGHSLRQVRTCGAKLLWSCAALHFRQDYAASHHVMVWRGAGTVGRQQYDSLLPSSSTSARRVRLGRDITRAVNDRHGAGAGVFDDLALDHVDERGAICMLMPGHDPTGFDLQPSQTQHAVLHIGGLPREIDGSEHIVGDAARGCRIHLLTGTVGTELIGGAGSGVGRGSQPQPSPRLLLPG